MSALNASNDSSVLGENGPSIPAAVWTIRIICIPVWVGIIVFGVVGNILTMKVLRSKKLSNSSTSLYLIAVAFIDLVYLATSLSFRLIDYIYMFPNSLKQVSAILCYFQPMLHYSSSYLSVWLLVAVTVDRMIWVVLPFRAKKICTRRKALITIACLCLFFIPIDAHFLGTLKFVTHPVNNSQSCIPISFKLSLYLNLMDLFLMGVCPFSVMIIANSLIIAKLRQIRKIRENHRSKSTTSSVNNNNNHNPHGNEDQDAEIDESSPRQVNTRTPAIERSVKRKERTSSLTTMLLSINVFFMVSITPLLVYDLLYVTCDLDSWIMQNEALYGPLVYGIEQIVYTLWYMNFSVHFLLYCMSGPKFRIEALKLFGIRPSHEVGEYQTGGTEMQAYRRRESCKSCPKSP